MSAMWEMKIRDGRTDEVTRELNDNQKMLLLSLVKNAGWEVLMLMMERECIAQTTKCLNVDASKVDEVRAEHAEAQGFWRFFVRLQKSINKEVQDILAKQIAEEDGPTPEEIEQRRIDLETARILNPIATE